MKRLIPLMRMVVLAVILAGASASAVFDSAIPIDESSIPGDDVIVCQTAG